MPSAVTDPSAPVLVTGAAGFIGERLVRRLSQIGHTVHAMCRGPLEVPPGIVDEPGLQGEIRRFEGDITVLESLKPAMEGCQAVYHLAGYARNWARDSRVYQQANTGGLENVLECARACGVQRVAWTSTMMTLGATPPGQVADESTPASYPPFTDYEHSKIAAEAVAARFAAGGLEVVTVNPTRVFGPGRLTEGNSLAIWIDRYDRGRSPLTLNRGRNVANYVFVEDVVEGLILAMQRGRSGERYLLGSENISLCELFDLVDRISGVRHFRFSVRRPGALTVAYLLRAGARCFGGYPPITPPWVRAYLADWVFSCDKARRDLGYSPRSIKEGLQATFDWILRVRAEKAS